MSTVFIVFGIICLLLAYTGPNWMVPQSLLDLPVIASGIPARSTPERRQRPRPPGVHHLYVPLVYGGNQYLHEVALTFDDGPSPEYTPQILAILKRYKATATFFCIGRQVARWQGLVKQELELGYAVGDHTWDHYDLTQMADAGIFQEVQSTALELKRMERKQVAFFRPPYGAMNANVLAQAQRLHLMTIMWSVDPKDWSMPGTESIVNTVEARVMDGSIVLMHDGGGNRSETVAALPRVIGWLRGHGYRIVPLQKLVDDLAYVPHKKGKTNGANGKRGNPVRQG